MSSFTTQNNQFDLNKRKRKQVGDGFNLDPSGSLPDPGFEITPKPSLLDDFLVEKSLPAADIDPGINVTPKPSPTDVFTDRFNIDTQQNTDSAIQELGNGPSQAKLEIITENRQNPNALTRKFEKDVLGDLTLTGGVDQATGEPNFALDQQIEQPVEPQPVVEEAVADRGITTTTGQPVLAEAQESPQDSAQLLEIRRVRKDLSSQLRRDNAQSLVIRQDLNRSRQQAINEGRNEDAAVIMQQIQSIANQGDAGKENLRSLLQLESSLRPEMSPERRQEGRDRLNAQLPGILADTQRQADQGAQVRQERLSTVGYDLIRLQTGLDPSGFSPEAKAKFAESASPEAVDRVTLGVGLPPAPGVDGTDITRIQDLINGGGVDFGLPTERIAPAPSQIQQALTFVGNQQADVAAQQAGVLADRADAAAELGIRESLRNTTEDTAAIEAAGVRKQAQRLGIAQPGTADPLALTDRTASGTVGQPQDDGVNLTESVLALDFVPANITDGATRSTLERVALKSAKGIEDQSIATDILKSASKTVGSDLGRSIEEAVAVFDTPGLDRDFRINSATELLRQIENKDSAIEIPRTGFFEGIMDFVDQLTESPEENISRAINSAQLIDNFFGPDKNQFPDAIRNSLKPIAENAKELSLFKQRLRDIING